MLKKAFFWFLIGWLMIVVSACDKHIVKKLKKDSIAIPTKSTDESNPSNKDFPIYPNGDLTGFPIKNNKVYLVASIKRTPCLGSCSIYEAKLYSDGKTTFFGRKNVRLKGRFEGQINQQQMQDLISQIQGADFFNLQSSYPINDVSKRVSEYSKTILTIQLGDQFNKVKSNNDGPESLIFFENYLDELFDRLEWVGK